MSMDTRNAVLDGTFADIKTVRSRNVVQIVVEMPIERMPQVIEMLGAPLPGNEPWVAVARLAKPEDRARVPQGSAAAKERYRAQDAMQQAVMRAAMLCEDERFHSWMGIHSGPIERRTEIAVHNIRARLGINSRREIGTDAGAYRRFLDLEAQFKVATGQMAEPR